MSTKQKNTEILYQFEDKPSFVTVFGVSFNYIIKFIPLSVSLPFLIAQLSGLSYQQALNLISMSLFASAISSLLQATKKIGGPGILAPSNYSTPFFAATLAAVKIGGVSLVCTMTILAGVFQIVLTPLLHKFKIIFTKHFAGFILLMMGVWLGSLGVKEFFQPDQLGQLILHANFSVVQAASSTVNGKLILVGFFTLGLMCAFRIWSPFRYRLYCLLIPMLIGWGVSWFWGLIPQAILQQIQQTPWFLVPHFLMPTWSFNFAFLLSFLLAGLLMTFSVFALCTAVLEASEEKSQEINMKLVRRSNFMTGVGIIISGFLGAAAQAMEPGSIAATLLTGALSKRIAYCYALLLCLLAFCPHLFSYLLSIPAAVNGAAVLFLSAGLFLSGLRLLDIAKMNEGQALSFSFALLIGLISVVTPEIYQQNYNEALYFTEPAFVYGLVAFIIFSIIFTLKMRKK
ncbi:MAG: hypothetical protein A3E87_07550 [Gammaproteobacteria bacterium RIFCSPHIGHO2_12_FULL_35_23]|nr:MAG: hypothetical protein A3E87_07550 [Gammaproteobacteria bacterium RIFCSPHIGHO2_12_FULL_35_23]